MKLSTKIILPLILISALLILLAGCFGIPTDESPEYTSDTYTMTTIAFPAEGGSVSGGGTYTAGKVVNITAIPAYQFVAWTGDDVADSYSVSTTVTMNADKTITAIFSEIPSDDSPGYTLGSITGTIMIPVDCSDCLTDGPCFPPRGISDDIPDHWVPAEEAIVTVIPHATLTDEEGKYTLTDVEPGVYYVITATYKNLVLKDVVEPDGVEAGKTYDAGTANCESTALGLYVEYLWDMEVDAGDIESMVEAYIETDKFTELVDTVCCIIEDCDNITNYCCLVLYMSIPTPACDETCTTISKPITVKFVGKDDVVINDFSDTRLDWTIPSGVSFTESSGEVCLTGAVGTYNIKVTYVDPEPDLCGSVSRTRSVTFSDCSCPLPADVSAGGPYSETVVCPATEATIDFVGSATGTGTLTYDWNFGDGTIALDAGSTPSHAYAHPFSGSPYTVTLTVNDDCGSVEATTTVTINYVPCEPVTYDLTMIVNPVGTGTTTPSVGGSPHTYAEGTTVTITAAAEPGYEFVDWTGDIANPNLDSTTVTMDADKTVTANFARENIITSINIAGWENAGCNPNFDHPHEPYSYIDSDPSGITGTISLPWLTVTNPNLKSVHFFANVDAGDEVTYRYTTDMDGLEFTDWITLGGGYVSSECIEIPGAIESPPIYPTDFYIEIEVNGDPACTINIW